jgi:hypothetical protein
MQVQSLASAHSPEMTRWKLMKAVAINKENDAASAVTCSVFHRRMTTRKCDGCERLFRPQLLNIQSAVVIFIEFPSIISLTIGNSAALASIDGPYNWTFDAAVTQINCRLLTNFYSVLPSAGGKRIGQRRINKRLGIPLAPIPPLLEFTWCNLLWPVINQMFPKKTAMPSLFLVRTKAFLPARIPIPSRKILT